MSWWKCTKDKEGGSFTCGRVYILDDTTGALKSDYVYVFGENNLHADVGGTINWLRNMGYEFEEVKDMDKFTMNDIKNGMLVKFRNGKIAIALRNLYNGTDRFVTVGDGCESVSTNFSNYDKENLVYSESRDYDIMEVRSPSVYPNLSDVSNEFSEQKYYSIAWKREEPKELTVAQLEEILGYKVKIVADKEAK